MDEDDRRAEGERLAELRLSAAYARGRALDCGLTDKERLLAKSMGQLFQAEADELQAELDALPPM